MSNRYRKQAIEELVNYKASFSLDENGKIVMWVSDTPQPSEEAISQKMTELQNAEPMKILRKERNLRLSETDYMALSDVTMTDAWKTYRQELRDITKQTPSDDALSNITFPTKPTE
jgi:hypothetical protein